MATPTQPIPISQTVDIGYGRGRLHPTPAASLWRIDAEMRRLGIADYADINDAWRSPEQADRNRAAWLAWQNGTGPKAPYALDRWGSIHCRGYAGDSDDWYYSARAAVWRRGGWRQTARYADSRDEPWHGEYDEDLDELLRIARTGGASGGSTPFPDNRPPIEEGDPLALSAEDMHVFMSRFLNYPAYDGGPTISEALKALEQGRDDTFVGKAPNRPFALFAPGYYRELNEEERGNLGLFAERTIEGNDRQFDLWRSIAVAGSAAGNTDGPKPADPKPVDPPKV